MLPQRRITLARRGGANADQVRRSLQDLAVLPAGCRCSIGMHRAELREFLQEA
jgi:hypothetical protein